MSAGKKAGDAGPTEAASADDGAAAIAATALRGAQTKDPALTSYLKGQAAWLALRVADHGTDHPLEQAHLRTRRWQDRAQLALLVGLAAITLAGAVGLGSMSLRAARSHDMIIESFSVPPELAVRGLSGKVVAQHVLDDLIEMDAGTQTALQGPATYRSGGEELIKIEIPDTGISIGELDRYLRRWLGHETRVTGEIVRGEGGYEITARFGDELAARASQPGGDLKPLIRKAAEGVFRRARPQRYVDYLVSGARYDEALPLLQQLAAADTATRTRALSSWAAMLMEQGDPDGALVKGRAAVAADPRDGPAQAWLGSVEWLMGSEERALPAYAAAAANWQQVRAGEPGAAYTRAFGRYFQIVTLERRRDMAGALQVYDQLVADGGIAQLTFDMQHAQRVADAGAAHDIALARRIAAGIPRSAPESAWNQSAAESWIRYFSGDFAGSAKATEGLVAISTTNPAYGQQLMVFHYPFYAEALAASGDLARAREILARTSMVCERCVEARGSVAAAAGEWGEAWRWFAAASRMAPSIASADHAWGRALLAHGDTAAALAKAKQAEAKAPKWADPLVLSGEALMAQGNPRAAVAKFRAAQRLASKWGRLHLKLGEALLGVGDGAGAAKAFSVAAGLHLTPQERAELAQARFKPTGR